MDGDLFHCTMKRLSDFRRVVIASVTAGVRRIVAYKDICYPRASCKYRYVVLNLSGERQAAADRRGHLLQGRLVPAARNRFGNLSVENISSDLPRVRRNFAKFLGLGPGA